MQSDLVGRHTLFLCPCRNQSTAAMAAPPTSQTDTTPFQGPAYFSAGTPLDEGNPFAFVCKTTQEPFNPTDGGFNDCMTNSCAPEETELRRTNESGHAAASFFDEYSAEPPPDVFQSHPTQGSHHMPRGPPVPSQGSPTAQAPVFPPPTHGALESQPRGRVTLPLHSLLPSQPPPPSQNSQMSQGPPPSQMLSYPPQWEQNITAARPSLEFQGEWHKWTCICSYSFSCQNFCRRRLIIWVPVTSF